MKVTRVLVTGGITGSTVPGKLLGFVVGDDTLAIVLPLSRHGSELLAVPPTSLVFTHGTPDATDVPDDMPF
jgi:hypothetical protein